jgi:hypothetical protein
MSAIALALLAGLFRAAHGSGHLKRAYKVLLIAFFAILYNHLSWQESLITVGGLFLGFAPGWGKYFAANGEGPFNRDEEEIGFIDIIVNDIKSDSLAGVIGMALRWSILFFPMFLFLSHPNYSLFLLGVGPIYFLQRYHHNWVITEFLSGALLGAILGSITL